MVELKTIEERKLAIKERFKQDSKKFNAEAITNPCKEDQLKGSRMIEFNLEQALAGESVITRSGKDVTEFMEFGMDSIYRFYGLLQGDLTNWSEWGTYGVGSHPNDLFMASPEPKLIKGFVNVWVGDTGKVVAHVHKNIVGASCEHSDTSKKLACIDLSQFPVGYGLD